MKKRSVKTVAVCVFRKGDRIFVGEGHDSVTKENFYRPLGGKIKFGEYAREALAREIREEIGVEIQNPRYLGLIETIFTFEGERQHEIVLVFEADFADSSVYRKSALPRRDKEGVRALWKPIGDFRENDEKLYPEGLVSLLSQRMNIDS